MAWGSWWRSLARFDRRVWILAGGRLLSQIGIGFTLFYAPIFFVEQVGLSTTLVGIGIGSQSVCGIIGRFLGGSLADSPGWGRRRTLLLSAAISAAADVALVLAQDFSGFVLGNLLMGLGVGLYWPSTEAVVADITTEAQRNEAYAITRLADSLGLSLGVVMGGALISATGAYRALFVIDGISYVLFFGIIWAAIAETLQSQASDRSFFQGWSTALKDTRLLIYFTVNILFTTYLAQIQSTLPVYFSQFLPGDESRQGLEESTLSYLFTWHVAFAALCQLPVARALRQLRPSRALMISATLWAVGFCLVWTAGTVSHATIVWAVLALSVMSLAMVAYTPIASSMVVMLAPDALRGVYLSVNSMCWAFGYMIGPPLGGWALDQSAQVAHRFWLAAALSTILTIGILVFLDRKLRSNQTGEGNEIHTK